jgi:hypothetical protein
MGTATSAQAFGRYPDGTDTQINEDDFSLMPGTPGASNGGAISAVSGATFDFTSVPSTTQAFQTFQTITAQTPAVGMDTTGVSGKVARIIDTTGGGVEAYFGDPALGGATGYNVTGMLFIPPSSTPAESLGLGICGRQGSTFFSGSPGNSGYESGYWLIYENGTTNLNDGQANHPGAFQFVMAKNDNMSTTRTLALGSNKTLANLGITLDSDGVWVPFRLSINPSGASGGQLLAQINNVDVYKGDIPTDGPTSGAFQVGYREITGAAVSNAIEGTWIDSLVINNASVPVHLTGLELE